MPSSSASTKEPPIVAGTPACAASPPHADGQMGELIVSSTGRRCCHAGLREVRAAQAAMLSQVASSDVDRKMTRRFCGGSAGAVRAGEQPDDTRPVVVRAGPASRTAMSVRNHQLLLTTLSGGVGPARLERTAPTAAASRPADSRPHQGWAGWQGRPRGTRARRVVGNRRAVQSPVCGASWCALITTVCSAPAFGQARRPPAERSPAKAGCAGAGARGEAGRPRRPRSPSAASPPPSNRCPRRPARAANRPSGGDPRGHHYVPCAGSDSIAPSILRSPPRLRDQPFRGLALTWRGTPAL